MRKYMYWFMPFIWFGVIYLFSSQPYEKQNIQPFLGGAMDLSFLKPYVNWIQFTYNHSIVSVEALGIEGFIEFFIRKGAHVFVFFVLCLLFFIVFRKTTKFSFITIVTISFLLTCICAAFDEFHQSFTPNRTAYIGDVVLDSFGALLAVVVLCIFQIIRKRSIVKK